MFARANVNVDTILNENDIESIYQKFLSDILQLSKSDSLGSFFNKLAQEVVNFLNGINLGNKEHFYVKKKIVLDRLTSCKAHAAVKNNANLVRILERVESDILKDAKDLKAKFFKNDRKTYPEFLSTIERIYEDERYIPEAAVPVICTTGVRLKLSKSPSEILADKLTFNNDGQLSLAEQFNLNIKKVKCSNHLAKNLFENEKYAQSITECYAALNCLKEIGPKYHTNEEYKENLNISQNNLVKILHVYAMKLLKEQNYKEAIINIELELAALDEIQNKTDALQNHMVFCQQTLAKIYYMQIEQLDYDVEEQQLDENICNEQKKIIFDKIIEALNDALSLSQIYGMQPDKINVIKQQLVKMYYERSEVSDYTTAVRDARLAITLSKETSPDPEQIKKYIDNLSMIERDFLSNLYQVMAQETEDELTREIPSSEDTSNSKKRKLTYSETYQTKRQKILIENQALVADILTKPEEVLPILDDVDFEESYDFVDFYKHHESYAALTNKFDNSIDTLKKTELACFCLPLLYCNINEIDQDVLRILLTPPVTEKLSGTIVKSLKLIQLALQYQQINESARQTLQLDFNAELTYANMASSKAYENINLSNAMLFGIHLQNANFDFAYMNNINLVDSVLSHASLTNSKLRNAHLNNAKMLNASLNGADMQGANFTNANLQEANLSYACCNSCDFNNANLSNTILVGVDFTNANLENANLTGAQFIPKHAYSDGSFSQELFQVLDRYKNHEQKDLIFSALLADILKYLTPDQLRTVLQELNAQIQVNKFALFKPTDTINLFLEKLASYPENNQQEALSRHDSKENHPTH